MNFQTTWERKKEQRTHFILIDHLQVLIGSTAGSGQTESTAQCSYADFLAGHFHPEILKIFDKDTLDAVLATVKNADTDPVFLARRKANQALLDTLYATPLDASLANLLRHPTLEKGSLNYGNAGGYKTILRSDTLTITLERDQGFLTPNHGGKEIAFTLPAHASSALAHQDHFYIVISGDFAIISPSGNLLPKENAIFGETLRINSVFRGDNAIFFSYQWLQNEFPRGWLRYEIGKGFTGRWVDIHNS